MDIDLVSSAKPTLRFSGLTGDAVRETVLPPAQQYYGFVSLYNRGASFTVLEAQEVG
jgi:hypothetical protein